MAQHFWIQLRERRGADPGAVEPGWFIIKDSVVILTDEHDKPLFDAGGRYEQRLAEGDKPTDIAAVLLRQWRAENRSGDDFRRPLNYPPTGWR
jgi:hypothetical protein